MITLTMPTARPYGGEADLQAVCDLLNAVDAVDHLDDNYSVEDLRTEFSDPRLDPPRDLRLWEAADGQLVGFGQLWHPQGTEETADAYLYMRVHPDARALDLDSAIIAWGAERAREVGREQDRAMQLRTGTKDDDTRSRAIFEQHGFAPVRYFFKMSRPLDAPIPEPQFPDGFRLRHVESEADVAAWVETFNLSFIDHWNHHPATLETHQHWLEHPDYRPEHDLVALAPDGTFAAFCFCFIKREDNARNGRNEGWIDMLGTRRGYRKLGLGRAMLLAGMQLLKAEGMDTAVLGVDAENPTGALRLYESVGFTPVSTSISYSKDL